MDLLKIDIIYPITTNLTEGEELTEIERMQNHLTDGYETDSGYWDLTIDPICQLNPRCFLPSNGKNKKYFTEVVFLSGSVAYAVGKPETILTKINEVTTK